MSIGPAHKKQYGLIIPKGDLFPHPTNSYCVPTITEFRHVFYDVYQKCIHSNGYHQKNNSHCLNIVSGSERAPVKKRPLSSVFNVDSDEESPAPSKEDKPGNLQKSMKRQARIDIQRALEVRLLRLTTCT